MYVVWQYCIKLSQGQGHYLMPVIEWDCHMNYSLENIGKGQTVHEMSVLCDMIIPFL